MTSITKLKTAQSIQYFDKSVALNLAQAFHRHLEIEALLAMFQSQAAALVSAAGIRYRYPDRHIDLFIAKEGRHTASYNLTYQEEELGELVVHFDKRVTEESLATLEDLIALVMSPVRNALKYQAACAPADSADARLGTATPATETSEGREDSLILLKLDGIADIRQRDGADWAQTLLQSVQKQVIAGLRDADGIYQIDDDTLAVILPHTPSQRAQAVAGKLRVLVASLHLKDGALTQQLTACMGIADTRDASHAETVLDQASVALARAEQDGPNAIVRHSA